MIHNLTNLDIQPFTFTSKFYFIFEKSNKKLYWKQATISNDLVKYSKSKELPSKFRSMLKYIPKENEIYKYMKFIIANKFYINSN